MLKNIRRLTRVSVLFVLPCCVGFGAAQYARAADPPDAGPGSSVLSAIEQFYRARDSALKEFGEARSDHAAVALDIGQCYYKESDLKHWSPTSPAILLFKLDEHLRRTLSQDMATATADAMPAVVLPVLNPFHTAAIAFSDRVSRDRLHFRRDLEESRSRSWWYQFWILTLGAGATVVVSLKSMRREKEGDRWSTFIGVSAIVLTAAGAAVSSMNSFDGSQAAVFRDQRALSQLQQLHWRIASDVLGKPNLCTEAAAVPGKEMEVVDAWRARLETILDSAVESISKPGDIISGGGGQGVATGTGIAGPNDLMRSASNTAVPPGR